jgi:hypothetical protein
VRKREKFEILLNEFSTAAGQSANVDKRVHYSVMVAVQK